MRDLPAHLPPVPVIETERLVLRGHRPDDFDAVHALWSDPEVVRYISGTPATPTDSQDRLLRYIGHWAAYGFGFWYLEDKATGRHAGDVGFGTRIRDMDPPITGLPEIGWVLSPHFHGKGYATEAARAARDWGDAHFGQTPTFCIIDPENAGSIRLAEKLGYTYWQTVHYNGDTLAYRR